MVFRILKSASVDFLDRLDRLLRQMVLLRACTTFNKLFVLPPEAYSGIGLVKRAIFRSTQEAIKRKSRLVQI